MEVMQLSDVGVVFPVDESGRRGSLAVNQAIWADSVRKVDPELAHRIELSEAWRGDYADFVHEITALCASSAEIAQTVAAAGLASAREHLVFERDGEATSLQDFADAKPAFELETETVRGSAQPLDEIVMPYRGANLRSDALRRQLADWVARGIIEPSASSAINLVMENPQWLRLAGQRIAVLGAGAQTSPLPTLSSWGVETVAVDLPRTQVWERILAAAAKGAGTMHFPVQADAEGTIPQRAGANVIEDLPELTQWLTGFADEPLVLGVYIYADGPLHVQATLAADLLGTTLNDQGQQVSMAYAGTPSDCFLVTTDAVKDSNDRRRSRLSRAVELPVRALTLGKMYAPAYEELLHSAEGEDMGIVDAIVTQQGPNYSLAKRLQRWRTIDSWRQQKSASFNVAPPTWTVSVTKNRILAAGYYGARSAGLEVFEPDTMSVLMTALLVHDLNVDVPAEHPELGLTRDGIHGGYWRVPYDIRSTLFYTGLVGIPAAYAPTLRFR